jgi:hypothetical protein
MKLFSGEDSRIQIGCQKVGKSKALNDFSLINSNFNQISRFLGKKVVDRVGQVQQSSNLQKKNRVFVLSRFYHQGFGLKFEVKLLCCGLEL